MLLAEQLQLFYELQPEMSTLHDMSAEISGLEVLQDKSQPDVATASSSV